MKRENPKPNRISSATASDIRVGCGFSKVAKDDLRLNANVQRVDSRIGFVVAIAIARAKDLEFAKSRASLHLLLRHTDSYCELIIDGESNYIQLIGQCKYRLIYF